MLMTRPIPMGCGATGATDDRAAGLLERIRARQAARRADAIKRPGSYRHLERHPATLPPVGLTVGGLIERLETFTGHSVGAAPGAFRVSPDDARSIDTLTAAAVELTGESHPAALRELVETVASRHAMRPADVFTMRVQSAAELVA